LEWRFVKSILALGSAPFVLQVGNALFGFILNNQLKVLGAQHIITATGALDSIGVVGRIAMFAIFPILGAAFAAQPLFGYNYGARNYARVKTTFKIAMIWVTAIGLFFWILIHVIPGPIVMIFGITDDLLAFTVNALKVQVFLMPLIGVQAVATQYFQSSGQPLKAMFLSLTRQILYLIPLIYLLPILFAQMSSSLTPLDGVYYAFPVSDVLSISTCVVFVIFEFRRLNRKIAEQSTAADAE
jgi:Na+-driven multidrug efflux pump